MKRTQIKNEIHIAKAICKFNKTMDKDWQKLYDKYKNLKLSHKNQEKLLMEFRNHLIAIQAKISCVHPEWVEKNLRKVNLALGYNQWTGVKEVK